MNYFLVKTDSQYSQKLGFLESNIVRTCSVNWFWRRFKVIINYKRNFGFYFAVVCLLVWANQFFYLPKLASFRLSLRWKYILCRPELIRPAHSLNMLRTLLFLLFHIGVRSKRSFSVTFSNTVMLKA